VAACISGSDGEIEDPEVDELGDDVEGVLEPVVLTGIGTP